MKKLKLFLAACAAMVGLSANAWDGSAGKVYLQNVGSGLYWGAGDHLNWGTRAMLVENPEYVTLSLADGVYKLESQVSNGGTAYYFNGDYMDNGSPVSLTITQSGDYWTIANGTTYYGYNGGDSKAIQDNANGLTEDSDGAKWIIRTHDEMVADLANGTVANPKDATFLFLDPGFGRNNRNVGSWTVSDDCTNQNLSGASPSPNNYGCGESYHSKFTISQSATVPNGVYKVSGRAFYRQDGSDNTHIPYLEANGQKSNFPLMNTGINSMKGAQESFMQGNWTIDPMIVEVTEGSLTIKMVCEQTGLWCILDGFELDYYGPITLADLPLDEVYVNSYNTALNAAKAYQSQDMFDADKTALNNAISANEFDASTKKQGELESVQAAINALNAAAAAASVAVNQYTRYTNAVSTINGGSNVDLTSIIGNPDFEVNPVQYQLVDGGWTNEGVGVQYQNNTGFDGYKSNTWFAERWVASGHIGAFKTSQSLTLPAGIYELSVVATFNGNGASMFVGDATTPITDAATYKLLFKATDKEVVTFGVQGVDPTGSWFKCDNFKLTYVGEDFPAYTLVDGKMSAAAATAQSNAETTFNNDKTVANYNALLAAIAAAQTSKDAYAKAATAIADAKALKEAHNFATADAITTFASAIETVEGKYNEGTLTDAEANNGANLGTVVVGWHAARSSENFTIAEAYMQSAWTGGELNDWSIEGDSDGSNFHVPFFQNWIADANSLAEGTTSGQLTGLDNGLYQVSAWVRVRIKNGQEAGTVPSGITLAVNDGEAVNACAGTQVGETQFYLATITAEGLVKDGTLNAVFTRSAENNVSWLSFKNIKYTKVRDLTPEEAAVVPTAIALDETEVALDATTTSKTFTLTFTPENATETVTWETSDASVATVADGVVTAVSSGTAIIAVKSTLDENVSASATVTVSFPETEVPEYTNDGAARYVHHYGDNIIKNGTFQYPNPFQGWKSGANGNCDANNFNIVTEDENKYIQAKQSMAAGDSHSISTGWPIEAGKTYVFGYKVKASKAGTMQFLVTSLTNSIGTETAQLDTENERKAKPVTTSWTDVKYEFTNSDNYAFVQFRARWMADSQSFDDFYLVEKTADDDVIGNVQYALDAIPTANIGTGAFQYSQDAINAANALEQGTATVEDVENAYAAVTTLNAPAAGQLYNIVVAEESNAKKGNALVIVPGTAGANNPTGYGLNVNLAPNTNLNQAVTFTKVEGNKYNISFETAEGTTYLTTGSLNGSAAGWKTQQIQATTDAEKKCAFTIVASTEANVFYIYNPEHKDYIDYQDGGALYTDTNIDHKAFSLVATTKPSITINTTAAGWGTTMLPFAVSEIPEGVKVYTCAGADGATLTLEEVKALEANKPYIIEGAWNATLTGDAQGTALNYTEGLLTGVYAQTPAPVGSYVLQKNDGKVGFYVVAEGKQPTVGANRAYVTRPAESEGVKAFYLGENDLPTAIQSVFDGLVDGDAYDLAGRKVQKLQKGGVYIINGKKVVVK